MYVDSPLLLRHRPASVGYSREEKLRCLVDGSYFDVPRVEFTVYEKYLETGQ